MKTKGKTLKRMERQKEELQIEKRQIQQEQPIEARKERQKCGMIIRRNVSKKRKQSSADKSTENILLICFIGRKYVLDTYLNSRQFIVNSVSIFTKTRFLAGINNHGEHFIANKHRLKILIAQTLPGSVNFMVISSIYQQLGLPLNNFYFYTLPPFFFARLGKGYIWNRFSPAVLRNHS